jgi:hypothetical protein
MPRSSVLRDADASADRSAPAFTPQESAAIAAWSGEITRHGLHAEITSGYDFLKEALQVSPSSTDELLWLVHKTPAGAVAVRQWPGLADIVATIPDALRIITAAVEHGAPKGA